MRIDDCLGKRTSEANYFADIRLSGLRDNLRVVLKEIGNAILRQISPRYVLELIWYTYLAGTEDYARPDSGNFGLHGGQNSPKFASTAFGISLLVDNKMTPLACEPPKNHLRSLAGSFQIRYTSFHDMPID
jgi:hypothetical protein